MSIEYDILSWDATHTGGQDVISPVITIKPDVSLLRMVQENNFYIPIKITQTDSIYDNKLAMAQVKPIQDVLGFRPYLQKETNTIAIIPDMTWNSYPLKLGKISVLESQENFTPIEERFTPSGIRFNYTFLLAMLMAILVYSVFKIE